MLHLQGAKDLNILRKRMVTKKHLDWQYKSQLELKYIIDGNAKWYSIPTRLAFFYLRTDCQFLFKS